MEQAEKENLNRWAVIEVAMTSQLTAAAAAAFCEDKRKKAATWSLLHLAIAVECSRGIFYIQNARYNT